MTNADRSAPDAFRHCGLCFVGSTRYEAPLDATQEKKWRALAVLGRICVLGFATGARPRRFSQHAHFVLLPDLPWPLARYLLFFLLAPWLLLGLVLRRGADLLIAQGPYEGAVAVLVATLMRTCGRSVAVVVESHGDFERGLFEYRRIRWQAPYRMAMAALSRFALKRADALRAVSAATRRQLETRAAGQPVVVFPAWTDIELFLAAGEARPGPVPPHRILYAGAIIAGKGVTTLVEAFARIAASHSETELVLIGRTGDAACRAALERRAADAGIAERVRFLDHCSQRMLARHMAAARVLVLPSRSEGLGRVLIEAMAAGTPVIATQVGGIPDIVRHGETGLLVPVDDAEGLARALVDCLTRPGAAGERAQRAREQVRRLFSTEAYVRHYAELCATARAAAALRGRRHVLVDFGHR